MLNTVNTAYVNDYRPQIHLFSFYCFPVALIAFLIFGRQVEEQDTKRKQPMKCISTNRSHCSLHGYISRKVHIRLEDYPEVFLSLCRLKHGS